MAKPKLGVIVVIVVLMSEASKYLFLWLQFDRPTANALSILVTGQLMYFLLPSGISLRKFTIALCGMAFWYWLVMKPLLNVLERRIGLWAFLVCNIVLIAPAIPWMIQKNKNVIKNISPEN